MGDIVFALLISLLATACVLLVVATIARIVIGGAQRGDAAQHEHQRSKRFFNRW